MELDRKILDIETEGGATIYHRVANEFIVIPHSIDLSGQPPLQITCLRNRINDKIKSISVDAHTTLSYSAKLQAIIKRKILSLYPDIGSHDLRFTILEPAKVSGRLVVPQDIEEAADWTFDVSPLGLWQGHLHIMIAPPYQDRFMKWWNEGASGLFIRYEYDLVQSQTLGFTASSDRRTETSTNFTLGSRKDTESTRAVFEAMRAKLKKNNTPTAPRTLQTSINLSKNSRAKALLNLSQ